MKEKGQTLIEILIALAAGVVIISAITTAVLSSLSNSEFSKNELLATQYAQQGIELIRSMRNTSYSTFASLVFPNYCLAKDCTAINNTQGDSCGQAATCPVNLDSFVRSVSITVNSVNCKSIATEVLVKVAWTDGKCTDRTNIYCHQVSITSCMSDYGVIPTATP